MSSVGFILNNRFKLTRKIGEGGMGAIHKALDQDTGADVAVKSCLANLPSHKVSLKREARSLVNLKHRYLPQVIDFFEEANVFYLVLEFIEGIDLAQELETQNNLFDIGKVLIWADQILDALEYLHSQKPEPILHCDIKPANLKVRGNGEIVLLDFGLVKGPSTEVVGHSVRETVLGATQNYAPLEQIKRQKNQMDGRSDLYALGATLYHLLTGCVPPSCLDRVSEMALGYNDPLSDTQKFNPAIPIELGQLIHQAMSLDKKNRPANASAMRQTLFQINAGLAKSAQVRVGTPIASDITTLLQTSKATSDNKEKKAQLPESTFEDPNRLVPVFQIGHSICVNCVSFSPDGQLLASGGSDETVIIYRQVDGKVLRKLTGHNNPICSVCFAPDGKTIASGSSEIAKVWDVKTGKQLFSFEGHTIQVKSLAFSPNGKLLATGDYRHIRIWDLEKNIQWLILESDKSYINSLFFSSDGTRLLSSGKKEGIKIWNVANGHLFGKVEISKSEILSSDIFLDGKYLVSGSQNGEIQFWDVDRLAISKKIVSEVKSEVLSVAFSPVGMKVAFGQKNGTIGVWDLDSNQVKYVKWNKSEVRGISFSPDGKKIASCGGDFAVRLFDPQSLEVILHLEGHKQRIWATSFSPDGNSLASGLDDGSVRVWNLQNGTQNLSLQGFGGRVRSVAFGKDGTRLASGSDDGSVRLWELQQGREIRSYPDSFHWKWIRSVAFSSDGNALGGAADDGQVWVWEVNTGKTLAHKKFPEYEVHSIVFCPKSDLLAVGGGRNGLIHLVSAVGDSIEGLSFHAHNKEILSLEFSPNTKLLASASADKDVVIWDVSDGHEIFRLSGHLDAVSSISFSPDGRVLASCSYDNTIRLWDVDEGSFLGVLQPLNNEGDITGSCCTLRTVRFAPNGKYIVSGGDGGFLHFWDFNKREIFLSLYTFEPWGWVALLPDGRFDASEQGLNYLTYTRKSHFDLFTGQELIKEFHDPAAIQAVLKRYTTEPPMYVFDQEDGSYTN